MAYIIKFNQLSSGTFPCMLYILMVFLCLSNDMSFVFSIASPLSKSVYLTLLPLGTCPSQESVGEWKNEVPMVSPTAAAHMVVLALWISATVAVPLPTWLAGYLA